MVIIFFRLGKSFSKKMPCLGDGDGVDGMDCVVGDGVDRDDAVLN